MVHKRVHIFQRNEGGSPEDPTLEDVRGLDRHLGRIIKEGGNP